MEIFTSYFGRLAQLNQAGIMPIGIALWPPRWYHGLHYQVIAPKRYMMKDDVTTEQYIRMYKRDVLGVLRPENVIRDIERISNGKDAALLCYEKPGEFCHRRLFAEWMLQRTGLEIPEWEPGIVVRPGPKIEPQPTFEEPGLFDGLI